MSSRVITGTKAGRAQALHLTAAFGTPVNAQLAPEERPAAQNASVAEMEAALLRIQVLERRIQELEAEMPKRFEAGRRAGMADGEKTGEASARREWQSAMDRLSRSIADLSTYPARFRRESEPEMLKLSIAIARKILRRELNVDPHSLLGVLKAVLESLNAAELVSVRLSAEDAAALKSSLDQIGLPQAVEVTGDRTLERGAILIETRRGFVDAGIQTQLAEIESGFIDRIAGQRTK